MAILKTKTRNTSSDTQYNNKTNITRQGFPTQELSNWLANRKYWDHNDWLTLLSSLRAQGYSELTESQEGRNTIGQYLEKNRSR